jgi:3-isopropylmalate dehydratase small subunit
MDTDFAPERAVELTEAERRANQLQNAREKQRRWRAAHGGRSFSLHADSAASLLYLKKQWGFGSYRETVEVALLHLAVQTRRGLKRIETEI